MRSSVLILMAAALTGTILAARYTFTREDAAVTRCRILYDASCASCNGDNLEGQPDWRNPEPDGPYPAPPHNASGHTWHHFDCDLVAYISLGGEEALVQMGVCFAAECQAKATF
jgi:hypothetical protein